MQIFILEEYRPTMQKREKPGLKNQWLTVKTRIWFNYGKGDVFLAGAMFRSHKQPDKGIVTRLVTRVFHGLLKRKHGFAYRLIEI